MTEEFNSQFADDLEREHDRRRQERGIRQAWPGQPGYNEPQRQRYQEYQDQENVGRWSPSHTAGGPRGWQENERGDKGWQGQHRRNADEWWAPGPYEGLGPKGYRRSDENIHEDICTLLTRHGQIDARYIEVQVENGEATLTGMVTDRRAKRLAEDLVESVPGVSDVHNRLRLV